jgi:hypothetical protein
MAQDRLDDIVERAFLPDATWSDDYPEFRAARAEQLAEAARKLIE